MVRPGHSDDQGFLEPDHILHLEDSFRDLVAPGYAGENVDEDFLDLFRRLHDAEGCRHMVCVGPSSNIAKVSGVSAELFDKVNCSYDYTCSVADDSNISLMLH